MEPTAKSLARTYSDRVYADPWEKVLDYRRVQQYAAKHPEAGRTRVGNALELPPSRVRGWLNDGQPDQIRGIITALEHGWLDLEPDSEMAAALIRLAAHILAGGSIDARYVPTLTPGGPYTLADLKAVFHSVGVETFTRNADVSQRATEVVASDGGTVLGRCLTTMGVPHGSKRDIATLPPALAVVPETVRRDFVIIMLQHRGVRYDQKATISVNEQRAPAYRDALSALIRGVTGEHATAGERGVIVSAAAVRELGLA